MVDILKRENVLHTVRNAIEKTFIGHEIIMAMPKEAINSFLEMLPERVIFLGISREDLDGEPKNPPACILARRILIRSLGGDTKKYLLTNPLRLHFNAENFFRLDEMEKWPGWLVA